MSNFGAGASKTGDIPNDYEPIASNFQAPAHNLNKDQAAEIIRLAEASHSHEQHGQGQSGYSTSGSGSTGSGSSSSGQHLQQARDALAGGGTGSVTQSHTGHSGNYELGQGDLSHNKTSLTGGDSSSYGHGAGAGAAGLGAGGLAATAANQGLGSRDQLSGQSSSSSGNNAGQYSKTASIGDSSTLLGNNTNDTAHRSTMNTSSNHGSGPTAASGTIENKLQAELERNAQKKNTHAAGFGTAGMSSDSGNLNHENSGISSTGGQASGGQGQGMQSGYGQSGYGQTGAPGYTTGATAVGTGAGLSGQHPQTSSIPLHGSSGLSSGTGTGTGTGYASGQQQGLGGRLADEVEHRAQGATGSNNVTGLGASGVNAQHGGASTSGLGNTGGLGHSTGRAL